jgi:hypothetical protein
VYHRDTTCTQGGVKVPTGGIPASNRGARERPFSCKIRGQQTW